MKKEQVIEKLKKGSKWITVICILGVLFNLLLVGIGFYRHRNIDADFITLYYIYRQIISSGISAVILAVASAMFARIAKVGLPFTKKNIRSTRIIGVLFLLNAAIPSVAALGVGLSEPVAYTSLVSPPALVEGLLFLFIAHVIRYGAMLQQESDETL